MIYHQQIELNKQTEIQKIQHRKIAGKSTRTEKKSQKKINKYFTEKYLMGLKDRNKLIPDEYCILALYFHW